MKAFDEQLNLAILDALHEKTTFRARSVVAEIVAGAVGRIIETQTPADVRETVALRQDGFFRLGQVLTPTQVREIRAFLEARPCFNAHTYKHSDRTPRLIGRGAENFHYGCYRSEDILSAPHLLELANRPEMIRIAQTYLGCIPTLYSLNAWWSFPGHGRATHSQHFHRDNDDFKFCTLFVLLTDVSAGSGEHLFIRQSHRTEIVETLARRCNIDPNEMMDDRGDQDAIYVRVFGDLIETVTGTAGLGFIADTFGLHKGEPPTAGSRLMFWARYGLHRNIHTRREMTPVPFTLISNRLPNDLATKYINRCLIDYPKTPLTS